MKKLFLLLFLVVGLVMSPRAFAHPGNTDSLGGHFCWTNCGEWGYVTGDYHFHYQFDPALITKEDCIEWLKNPAINYTADLLSDYNETQKAIQETFKQMLILPTFEGARPEDLSYLIQIHRSGLNSLLSGLQTRSNNLKNDLAKWRAKTIQEYPFYNRCEPYYDKVGNGKIAVKQNMGNMSQANVLDSFAEEETQVQVIEVSAPANFKLERKKKYILVTWQNNQAVGYEYILTKKYYERADELEDSDEWKEIEKPSIKFKRTKARQGGKYYLYIRAFDANGNESSIVSVNVQF